MDIIKEDTTVTVDKDDLASQSNVLADLAAAYNNDDDDDDEEEISSLTDSIEDMEKFQQLDTSTNRSLIRDPIIDDGEKDLLISKSFKEEHMEHFIEEMKKKQVEHENKSKNLESSTTNDDKDPANVDVGTKEKPLDKFSSSSNDNNKMEQDDSISKDTLKDFQKSQQQQEPSTSNEESNKDTKMEEGDCPHGGCPSKSNEKIHHDTLQSISQTQRKENSNTIPSTSHNTKKLRSEDSEENVLQFHGDSYQAHRINESSEETSSEGEDFSGNDESDSDSNDSEPRNEENVNLNKKKKVKQPPKVKGELSVTDLPPIEDLQISVAHEKCQAIGVIKSFVDPLVIVEGYPNSPALNLDSVLFVEQGDRALGHIFDVFGQVKQPHYCVRFNSKDHVSARGIQPGMTVYCAPSTPHSKFIFLAQLEKLKGTDASWLDDVEPPQDVEEFSDDEQERFAKKIGKGRRKKGKQFDASIPPNQEQDNNEQRNAGMPRKRNYNYVENDNTQFSYPPYLQHHPHSYPQRSSSSPYVPSYVPGFAPSPPFYPPSNMHPHFYDRGGRRMQHFRPHYENSGFNRRGSWSSFEQTTRNYWRPPPIQGKPNWPAFAMPDQVPFDSHHPHHPHQQHHPQQQQNRPRLFPKSVASQMHRIENVPVSPSSSPQKIEPKKMESKIEPPPPGC